jgi:tRNA-specific 2-thiouridylase
MALARRVAAQLEIPFYVLDVQEAFYREVVEFFINGYAQGITPNPCIQCNRMIRWTLLLKEARALGATHLATGHYARLAAQNGRYRLLRAMDHSKDQSYVLSALNQAQLSQALFPLGEMYKDQVRQLARDLGLPAAERPESQDLCFLAGQDYRQFLRAQRPSMARPGPILDLQGHRLGQHGGLIDYTLGQRKGLGISASSPLYVVAKDLKANALIVGPRQALQRSQFEIDQANWISGSPPAPEQNVTVMVRYRAAQVEARVIPLDRGRFRVELARPLDIIAPGQWAAFYHGEECLGGGQIQP